MNKIYEVNKIDITKYTCDYCHLDYEVELIEKDIDGMPCQQCGRIMYNLKIQLPDMGDNNGPNSSKSKEDIKG